jgi:hypothetical protein
MTIRFRYTFFLAFTALLTVGWVTAGAGADVTILVDGPHLTATLDDVPLSSVIEKFESEMGIWVANAEAVPDWTRSLSFSKTSVKDGLGRIFDGINHILVFEPDGQLAGIVFIARVQSGAPTAGRDPKRPPQTPRSTAATRPADTQPTVISTHTAPKPKSRPSAARRTRSTSPFGPAPERFQSRSFAVSGTANP